MEMNISSNLKKMLLAFLLIILPLILLILGLMINFKVALFYILSIVWFGMGMIFFYALD